MMRNYVVFGILIMMNIFELAAQDYKKYPRYIEVIEQLKSWKAEYPHLLNLERIATTHELREVYAVRISNQKTDTISKSEVLYVAGTHGCEPLSVAMLMQFAGYLLENYTKDSLIAKLLNERDLWLVPLLNPDGYEHYWRGNLAWKANRSPNDGKAKGVDLNRNFGYQWGFNNKGSKSKPWQRSYRGDTAFSEPESKGLRDLVLAHDFILSFSYHSFGEQLLFPYNYTDRDPEDLEWYLAYCNHLAKQNGYTVGNPKRGTIHYANGDMDDWLYGNTENGKRKTLAVTVELSKLFLLPLGGIQKHFEKVLYQNLFMPLIAEKPQVIFDEQVLSELEIQIKETIQHTRSN